MSHQIEVAKPINLKEHTNEFIGGETTHTFYANGGDLAVINVSRIAVGDASSAYSMIHRSKLDKKIIRRLTKAFNRFSDKYGKDKKYFVYYEAEHDFYYFVTDYSDKQLVLSMKCNSSRTSTPVEFYTNSLETRTYADKERGVFINHKMSISNEFRVETNKDVQGNVILKLSKELFEYASETNYDKDELLDTVTRVANIMSKSIDFNLSKKTEVFAVGDNNITIDVWQDFKRMKHQLMSEKEFVEKHSTVISALASSRSIWIINNVNTYDGILVDTIEDKKAKALYELWLD